MEKKKNLTFRKKYAKNMAHSRQLSEQYAKIIIGNDDYPTRVVVREKKNTPSKNK